MESRFLKWISIMLCCVAVPCVSQEDVRHPPDIFEPIFASTKYFLKNFNISCRANGTPKPTYTWLKDNSPITSKYIQFDQITGKLWVKDAMREEGVFRCLANNTWGTSVSYEIRMIQIRNNPFTDTGTKQESVEEGVSTSFACREHPEIFHNDKFGWWTETTVTGSGGKSNSASSLKLGKRLGVDSRGTLHFAYVKKEDEHTDQTYSCGVQHLKSNEIYLGSRVRLTVADSNTRVTPKSKPRQLYFTGRTKGFIGKVITLECFFGGNPAPDIQWFDNNKKQITFSNAHHTVSDYGRRLTIANITDDDEGEYRCLGINNRGQLSAIIYLNVTSKPIWVETPASQVKVEGSNVTFKCSAKAAHREIKPSDPTWYENGVQVTGNDSRIVDAATFHMANISRDHDIMNIQCSIANEFGTIFKDAYLNILSPTKILSRPNHTINIAYGDRENLSIKAKTDPSQKLVYRWKRNGQYIPLGRRGFQFNRDSSAMEIITGDLSLAELNKFYGNYTCDIINDVETVVVDIEVIPSKRKTLTESVVIADASTGYWWILAVVLGILLVAGSAFLIMCVLKHYYPKEVYLLEKKELKHKLDPVRDLKDDYFKTL